MKLVTNGRLITRNADAQGYFEHGAVAFEGTKIVEVGEEAALRAKYPGAEIIDAKGGVIMPAFINAHTHIYSALARGLSIVGNNPRLVAVRKCLAHGLQLSLGCCLSVSDLHPEV